MRLFIKNEADRLTVAAILIKNGYTVRQTKVPKSATSTTQVSCLEAFRQENEKGE